MKDKKKFCRECYYGEIENEPAVAKVRHPNERDERYPPVTKWVCSHHFDMLADDYGDDLKVIERIN